MRGDTDVDVDISFIFCIPKRFYLCNLAGMVVNRLNLADRASITKALIISHSTPVRDYLIVGQSSALAQTFFTAFIQGDIKRTAIRELTQSWLLRDYSAST